MQRALTNIAERRCTLSVAHFATGPKGLAKDRWLCWFTIIRIPGSNRVTTPVTQCDVLSKMAVIRKPPELLSPPWKDELSDADIEAVTEFIDVLRYDFNYATQLLASVEISPGKFDGKKIYRARCETCHGASGKGDGRMSRIVRNPSPADLTRSTLSHDQTIAIVSSGGRAQGRSERMPPWGQELLYAELVSVVNYLESIRTAQAELSD